MAIQDIFSKRKRRLSEGVSDVYSYDSFPVKLRNQIVFVVSDLLDHALSRRNRDVICKYVAESIAREWGWASLVKYPELYTWEDQLKKVLTGDADIDHCLDVIEFLFGFAEGSTGENDQFSSEKNNGSEEFLSCVEELNQRFKENGIGYEYLNRQIVRIDSQILHGEVVKPAIIFLQGKEFEGAQDEFLHAHEHYRHKRYKEALVDALKSFESTMKTIAQLRGFAFDKRDTARKLIDVFIKNNFFPAYYQNHFSALAQLLESSVPTIRNAEAGHGQGPAAKEVSPHIVAYTLHMTASAVVLLVSQYRECSSS